MSSVPAVLFACVHNAGRSQMAAAWLRDLAGDRVEVYSGGSEPADVVNPQAVVAMAEMGIDMAAQVPRAWTPDLVARADVVVTMGCGDSCPVLPGTRHEDWAVRDPAGASLDVARDVRDDIRARVVTLMASLDLAPRR